MANTIDKDEPYKLVKTLIQTLDEKNLRDPDKEFHKIYVTITSEYKHIDKVDEIAHIIYNLPLKQFENLKNVFGIGTVEQDIFSDFVRVIEDTGVKGFDDEKFDKVFSDKFEEHLRLCCHQRDFMMKISQTAESTASNAQSLAEETKNSADITTKTVSKIEKLVGRTEKVVENTNTTADEAMNVSKEAKKISDEAKKMAKDASKLSQASKKIMDEVSDTKTSIYGEFIAILGVFTAIAFVLMGSIQTFGTVFSKVDNPSSASIGYAILAGAVYLVIMIVLITVLFVGMQKVLKPRKEPFPWWTVNVSVFSILFLVIIGIILLRM